MFNARFLLPPLFAVAVVVLAGALYWPSTPQAASAPPPPPPLSTKPDPAALKALDRALAALDPARVQWLEVMVWQQLQLDGLTFQAEGRYLAGPEQRFRLDLHTQVGDTNGQMQVVSDGKQIQQATRIGEGAWNRLTPINLSSTNATAQGQKEVPPLDSFLQGQLTGGLPSLLRTLRTELVWVRKDKVRRQGRILTRLTARVPGEKAQDSTPPGMPRQARLYLDPQTHWPHRLEWWARSAQQPEDELVMQMELREPVLNRALSAEQCANVFAMER